MPTPKPRKRLRPRGFFGRWKWVLIPVLVLLFIPAMQVVVVRFVNPPLTLPMLIEQGGAMFSSAPQRPLLYRWIALPQIPEMFLEHLWISEDQRTDGAIEQDRFPARGGALECCPARVRAMRPNRRDCR